MNQKDIDAALERAADSDWKKSVWPSAVAVTVEGDNKTLATAYREQQAENQRLRERGDKLAHDITEAHRTTDSYGELATAIHFALAEYEAEK